MALSGVSNGQGDGCDGAKSPLAPSQHSCLDRNGTATPAGAHQLQLPLPLVAVEQAGLQVGNPDASLFLQASVICDVDALGSGVAGGHGCCVHADCFGSVLLRRAACIDAPQRRSPGSSGCRDHSGCTPTQVSGIERTNSVGLQAPSANGGRRGLGSIFQFRYEPEQGPFWVCWLCGLTELETGSLRFYFKRLFGKRSASGRRRNPCG